MIKWHYFIFILAVIFLLERLLPMTGLRPVSLFPLFAVIFLLRSRDFPRDFSWLAASSLFFDLFSGFEFGIFSLVILLVAWTIYLARRYLLINKASLLSLAILYLFFVSEYLAVFWFQFPQPYLISNIFYTLIWAAAFYFLTVLVLGKITHDYAR